MLAGEGSSCSLLVLVSQILNAYFMNPTEVLNTLGNLGTSRGFTPFRSSHDGDQKSLSRS